MKKLSAKAESIKEIFHTSVTKHGTYSVGITVIVIAIAVVFNLIISQIPEGIKKIDVSNTKIYDISDKTTELLDRLDKDVDMKILAVKDETDERIVTFINKYAGLSDRISTEWIDPVLHPSALSEYNVSENTIIVSCADTGKSTEIAFGDILVMDEYSYYYYGSASYTEFDGEGQLTSAVNYVTGDTEEKIYVTSGHGESALSETVSDLMEKNNYQTEEINMLMKTQIPADCDLLLMNAPSADMSSDEADMLRGYLGEGGKVLLLFGDDEVSQFENLTSVMEEYGIMAADGYIADPTRCYQGNPYYIFPELSVYGELGEGISSGMVLLTYAHGMSLSDPARDTISVTGFMSSSDQSYAVTESSQKQGSYTLGAVATETVGSDEEKKESRLTVISAESLISEEITDTFTQLENTQIFMNAVAANFDGTQNLSIGAKSLGVEYNTVQHAGLFSVLMVFAIPAVIIIAGFAVWFRRRKA